MFFYSSLSCTGPPVPLPRTTGPLPGKPRLGYGNPEGRPEEPMQAESAIPAFLSSLREAGIELPQGIHLLDK